MAAWHELDRPLILASQSPRRQEILSRMGMRFSVIPPCIANEEAMIRPQDLEASMQELACAKARTVGQRHPEALVLGGDTVVLCDGRVMGKPRDVRDAEEMLWLLSGREHRVLSSVALVCIAGNFSRSAIAVTSVRFRGIEPQEMSAYLASGDYADKAGAYAIQGAAMQFIEGINGCYYNVVGLPVTVTITLFKQYAARKELNHAPVA